MKFKYKALILIAPIVFVLDQLTKLAVVRWIPAGERIQVLPGFFDLSHYYNKGAAFGMFAGSAESFRIPFFYAVSILAAILLIIFVIKLDVRERLMPIALSLVLGGIAGNTLDRIRIGAVIDFLSFHVGEAVINFTIFGKHINLPLDWPAFNIADSAITVAMVLIIYSTLFCKPDQES
jgi:signal peptidase II